MPKSSAERQKARRERLKAQGLYHVYRQQQAQYARNSRLRRMQSKNYEDHLKKRRLRYKISKENNLEEQLGIIHRDCVNNDTPPIYNTSTIEDCINTNKTEICLNERIEVRYDNKSQKNSKSFLPNSHENIIFNINKYLILMNVSPINLTKMDCVDYKKEKCNEIISIIRRDVFGLNENDTILEKDNSSDSEIIQQLKEKFENCKSKDEKYQILTTLPKSWSSSRIELEFNVSSRMAHLAKIFQEENGIMSIP